MQGLCKTGPHYPTINTFQPTLFKQPKSSHPVRLGLSVSDLYNTEESTMKTEVLIEFGVPSFHFQVLTLVMVWLTL